LEFPAQAAASIASVCRRSWRQASELAPATIGRADLQVLRQVPDLQLAGAVGMWSNPPGRNLPDYPGTCPRSCVRHTVAESHALALRPARIGAASGRVEEFAPIAWSPRPQWR